MEVSASIEERVVPTSGAREWRVDETRRAITSIERARRRAIGRIF
jgi:hypothetical protein